MVAAKGKHSIYDFSLVANRKGRTSRWGLSSCIPRADKGEGIKNLLALQIALIALQIASNWH
jgi:hypothetical protein